MRNWQWGELVIFVLDYCYCYVCNYLNFTVWMATCRDGHNKCFLIERFGNRNEIFLAATSPLVHVTREITFFALIGPSVSLWAKFATLVYGTKMMRSTMSDQNAKPPRSSQTSQKFPNFPKVPKLAKPSTPFKPYLSPNRYDADSTTMAECGLMTCMSHIADLQQLQRWSRLKTDGGRLLNNPLT